MEELTNDIDFDSWFDIFQERCQKSGYRGPIDKYSFEWEWESGKTPEAAADEFVEEMNAD